jgi:type II secretory pathway pseudopilin PulG
MIRLRSDVSPYDSSDGDAPKACARKQRRYAAEIEMKRRNRYSLIVLGTVAILLAIVIPGAVKTHRETLNAKRALEDYTAALIAHRYDKAYSLGCTDFQKALSYRDFLEMQKMLEVRYGPLTSAKQGLYLVRNNYDGKPTIWTATIDTDLVYQKADLKFAFTLHKEDGAWKVFGGQRL